MKEFETGWKSQDGLDLYVRGWQPDADEKAVVALVHGLGEHVGRYAHMGDYYCKAGYALMGLDLRGHGKSGGARGVTPSMDALLDDITRLLEETRQRFPGKPVFLYGHSLGGNLSLGYALKRRPALNGMVVSGPWLRLAFEPAAWKLALAKSLVSVMPSFAMANGLERPALSRDLQVVEKYSKDPLVHDRISARLFVDTTEQGEYCLAHASEFPLQLLLIQGGADRLESVPATREFARDMGEACTLKIWEGFYHEIHNEPEKEQVFDFTLRWLDAHL